MREYRGMCIRVLHSQSNTGTAWCLGNGQYRGSVALVQLLGSPKRPLGTDAFNFRGPNNFSSVRR